MIFSMLTDAVQQHTFLDAHLAQIITFCLAHCLPRHIAEPIVRQKPPVAHPKPPVAPPSAGGISQVMPNGATSPPPVPIGTGNAPWVSYLDPWGNWAFLYEVTNATNYPLCGGNFGQYSTGDNTNGGTPYYDGLVYGTCPSSVFHWGVGGNQWGTQSYSNCWTGYYNWGQTDDGYSGTSTFPNGMRTGYCCFN